MNRSDNDDEIHCLVDWLCLKVECYLIVVVAIVIIIVVLLWLLLCWGQINQIVRCDSFRLQYSGVPADLPLF